MDLLLASASPRRQQLLEQLGVCVDTVVTAVDETVRPDEAADAYVRRLAIAKAQQGQRMRALGVPTLGADTAVVVDEAILGKPKDKPAGLRMLALLSGRSHQVYSAVAVCHGARCEHDLCVSRVWFASLSASDRAAYWATGEPLDKAGGYAIQGLAAQYIVRLEGSFSGVMGLPLYETSILLKAFKVLKSDI